MGAGGMSELRPPVVGIAFAWLATTALALGPLAVAERAIGLDGGAAVQLVLVPLGMVGGLAVLRGIRPLLAKPTGRLTITPERLEFDGGGAVDRAAAGTVVIDGDEIWGRYVIAVHDPEGVALERWTARWPGRRQRTVVGALARQGWQAAVAGKLYDGRFQSLGPR
jgi:hypothetical protein